MQVPKLEARAPWRPIESAPKDKHLLLFGAQKDSSFGCGVKYLDPFVFSGYWDAIDGAWCSHGTTYRGPFFNVTHWQPLPEGPFGNEQSSGEAK